MSHHNMNWYDEETASFARRVEVAFGLALNEAEQKSIRDAMYRAVNDAKVRQELGR